MSRHVLMCEPTHYRIAYEINPWMRREHAVDEAAAHAQWTALRDVLVRLGVRVDLVEQGADVPDMVFAANAGVVLGRRFLAARFRFPQRQLEVPRFERWFGDQGYEVARLPEGGDWEGEGDVLPCGDIVFAGHGFRTDERALDHLDVVLGAPTVRLQLVDPRFYHLDTCLFPVAPGLVAYFPAAFSEASRARLRARIPDLVEVAEDEALRFACNAVLVDGPVDRTVVLNDGCDAVTAALRARGYRCIETPTSEFIKAGGSVKCLVLMLDAFAAAS